MRSLFSRPNKASPPSVDFVALAKLPRIELAKCALCPAQFPFVPHRFLCWSCRVGCRVIVRGAVPQMVVPDDVTRPLPID